MLQQGETLSDALLDPSELNLLLGRISVSKHFKRAPRLRAFLEYVCEETVSGRAGLINEQTVGNRVFGRAADYDPSSDNIVRVEAREVRKRLEAYFAAEGIAEPIVIRVPKGRYAVTFEPREALEALPPEPPEQPVVVPPNSSEQRLTTYRVSIGVLAALVVFLTVLSVRLYRVRSEQPANTTTVNSTRTPLATAFWARIFDPKRPTLIALPDSNYSLLQDLRSESVPSAEYTSGRYLAKLRELPAKDEASRIVSWIAARHYTGLGDVGAMTRIMTLNRSLATLGVRSARDVTIRDLKSQNVILFGSARSNPWVEFLSKDARFVIGYDTSRRRPFLQDQKPGQGKPTVYVGGLLGSTPYDAYGLIACTPNLDGTGHAIVVAGTNTQGTEAAGEFLADSIRFEEFLQQIGWRDQRALPTFEVALKVVAVEGSSVSSQILGYHLPVASRD
jgi:hypothetical protein